jgi:hypothetical protein
MQICQTTLLSSISAMLLLLLHLTAPARHPTRNSSSKGFNITRHAESPDNTAQQAVDVAVRFVSVNSRSME